MSRTPNLSMPFVLGGQANADVLYNEGLVELDAVVQLAVEDRHLTAPPGGPSNGEIYIPAATATDEWVGKEDKVLVWYVNSWKTFTPKIGWEAWIKDEKITVRWDGTSWKTKTGNAMFFGRKTSNTALTGSFAAIEWNARDRYDDGVYEHSTSVDPELISARDAGDYVVDADVTIDATSGTSHCEIQISVNGSPITGTLSYCSVISAGVPDRTTVRVKAIVTCTASDDITIEARIASGGGAAQLLGNGCRVAVSRG